MVMAGTYNHAKLTELLLKADTTIPSQPQPKTATTVKGSGSQLNGSTEKSQPKPYEATSKDDGYVLVTRSGILVQCTDETDNSDKVVEE
jgi:hypothetical protein